MKVNLYFTTLPLKFTYPRISIQLVIEVLRIVYERVVWSGCRLACPQLDSILTEFIHFVELLTHNDVLCRCVLSWHDKQDFLPEL
jgi:hypothetical protein